jgi:hypothetical protein
MMIGAADSSIHQQNIHTDKTDNRQLLNGVDKTGEASKAAAQKSTDALKGPHDEYIPGGDKSSEAPGLYRLEKDENGQQKIVFDRSDSIEKSEQAGLAEKEGNMDLPEVLSDQTKNEKSPDKKDGPEKSTDKEQEMKCTVNTDQVDAEIKKLKEEKQQIEQQLNRIRDDEDRRKELEKQLSLVESELSVKDTDAYRKQHASYTYS